MHSSSKASSEETIEGVSPPVFEEILPSVFESESCTFGSNRQPKPPIPAELKNMTSFKREICGKIFSNIDRYRKIKISS
jgi:hypothetical protein